MCMNFFPLSIWKFRLWLSAIHCDLASLHLLHETCWVDFIQYNRRHKHYTVRSWVFFQVATSQICNEGRALRLEHVWDWALRPGQTWEVTTWENAFGKVPNIYSTCWTDSNHATFKVGCIQFKSFNSVQT